MADSSSREPTSRLGRFFAERAGSLSELWVGLFLGFCAALPYANTLFNGFVSDDDVQILNNPYIRNFRHFQRIFGTTVWSYVGGRASVSNYYRPLMTFGYLICFQLFGEQAWGYHLVNILMHAAITAILFMVTKRLFQSSPLALVASALFVLHPVHTEAVASVAAVTELELVLFCLLTFWFFLAVARPGGGVSLPAQLGMTVSFLLGLVSKEQTVTLPLLATVYEHFCRDDRAQTTWLQKLIRYGVLWLVAAAYLGFRVRFFGALGPVSHRPYIGFDEQLFAAVGLIGQYLRKLIWPVRLCAWYVFPENIIERLPWMLEGLGLLGLYSLVFALVWKRWRLVSFGLLWILVTLAPVLNVRWMPSAVFAERYLYLPSVGFSWVVAWGFWRLWELASGRAPAWRGALATAFCLIAVCCVVRIITRNRDWLNDEVLYTRTLAVSPDASPVHNSLGAFYWNKGDIKAAEREWLEAQKLEPDNGTVLQNLALLYIGQKRYDEALVALQRALQASPNDANAYVTLGMTYNEMGMRNQAEEQFTRAITLAPLNVRAHNRLGELYLDEGRFKEAGDQFRRSLESVPTSRAFFSLGLAYWRSGDRGRAEETLKQAESMYPSYSRVHFVLGLLYQDSRRNAAAVRELQKGLELEPNNPEALAALKKLKSETPGAKASNY